jgi:DNA-directed RNA polymerase specialized sigma24 family protein
VRDLGLAEDLAQDALVDALRRWPESGVPDNPGAWLMAAAKLRAIDLLRRNKRLARKQEELARELGVQIALGAAALDAVSSGTIEDDVLRLMFACCHPLLSTEARLALTLRLLGGLTTPEIARAFLVSERCAQRKPNSTSLEAMSWPRAWTPCSRCSTSSSTRATRRQPDRIGRGRCSARRRCASGGSSQSSRRTWPKCMVWFR